MFTPMSVGRFVRAVPVDLLENRVEDREDLHIPVVVDGRLTVRLQMERIDHVHIVEISRGRLVGKIDRMASEADSRSGNVSNFA